MSGTHTFASTGTKDVVVTITETDSPSNPAVVHSTFTVVPACGTGQVCTASVPGVQTTTVVALNAKVSLSIAPDPTFTCNDTFQHTPLVMTFSSTGGTKLPKLVVATIDKSQVGTHKPADFHICYGAGEAFTDLNGHRVPAGGNGLLPFCVDLRGKTINPPPCELPTLQLKGNIVESFLAPGNDPKAH